MNRFNKSIFDYLPNNVNLTYSVKQFSFRKKKVNLPNMKL